MKTTLFFIAVWLFSCSIFAQVGINTSTPNAKSMLDVQANNKGVLLPRLSAAERDAMTPGDANGLTVYNTTTNCYSVWNSSDQKWNEMCPEVEGEVEFSNCEVIKTVGVYDMNQPMAGQTVRIDVPVKVGKTGKYNYSATSNGVTFTAKGSFTNLGPQTVSLYPSSGTPISAGKFPASVTIAPITNNPSGLICNNDSIRFRERSNSNLKILNIPGTTNSTSLTKISNYVAANVYGTIGKWLSDKTYTLVIDGVTVPSPLSYAGTASISVVDVPVASIATLKNELADASIVWVGSGTTYSAGYAQLIADWYKAGNGVIIITGDKIAESTITDACGYYIENGAAGASKTLTGNLPQVFSNVAPYSAPFNVPNDLAIASSGSNCGYISSNHGVPIMKLDKGFTSAYADIDNDIFIFGDKFGEVTNNTTAQWKDFAKVLTDIFAWSLKNAPIR